MSEEKRQEQEDWRLLEAALKVLSEHFDSVHIFATRHEAVLDGTVGINKGCGNWHARYGQIREWIIQRDEDTRLERREKHS